jgi:hypothetical protein
VQKALYIVPLLRWILICNSWNPSRRVKLAIALVCLHLHRKGSSMSAAPFGAFIFTGGAAELAGVDAWSQPNCLTVASHHRRLLLSQGERVKFPTSPRCLRWKPCQVWWTRAWVTTYSGEPPPRSHHPYRLSRREPSIPALTAMIRLSNTPSYFFNLSRWSASRRLLFNNLSRWSPWTYST